MHLMLDHTRRSLWQECKRKSLYRDFCGLKPMKYDSSGLEFGKAIHLGTEVIDRDRDLQKAKQTFSDFYPDQYSSHTVRSLSRGHDLLEAYYEFSTQQNFSFILHETEPGAELSFQIPLTSDISHVGRCDRFLSDGTPIEIKTTYYLYDKYGSAIDYLTSWQGHNSIKGYAWITKATKAGVIGLGVYPQGTGRDTKTTKRVLYYPIDYLIWDLEPHELEVWEHETKLIGEEILSYYKKFNLIPQDYENNLNRVLKDRLWINFTTNTSRCNDYHSRCQYKDLCLRDVPEGMIAPYYYVEAFEPWKLFQNETDGEG